MEHPTPREVIGNSKGKGVLKSQNFIKESMKLNCFFQRERWGVGGGGSNTKKMFWKGII